MICSNCQMVYATKIVTGPKITYFSCEDCIEDIEDEIDRSIDYSDLDLTPYDPELLDVLDNAIKSLEELAEKPKRGDGVAVVYISRKQLGLDQNKDQ